MPSNDVVGTISPSPEVTNVISRFNNNIHICKTEILVYTVQPFQNPIPACQSACIGRLPGNTPPVVIHEPLTRTRIQTVLKLSKDTPRILQPCPSPEEVEAEKRRAWGSDPKKVEAGGEEAVVCGSIELEVIEDEVGEGESKEGTAVDILTEHDDSVESATGPDVAVEGIAEQDAVVAVVTEQNAAPGSVAVEGGVEVAEGGGEATEAGDEAVEGGGAAAEGGGVAAEGGDEAVEGAGATAEGGGVAGEGGGAAAEGEGATPQSGGAVAEDRDEATAVNV